MRNSLLFKRGSPCFFVVHAPALHIFRRTPKATIAKPTQTRRYTYRDILTSFQTYSNGEGGGVGVFGIILGSGEGSSWWNGSGLGGCLELSWVKSQQQELFDVSPWKYKRKLRCLHHAFTTRWNMMFNRVITKSSYCKPFRVFIE